MQAIEKTTLNKAELQALAAAALCTFGIGKDLAGEAANILVLADMMGLHTHGTARILSYGERMEIGGITANADIRVRDVAPAMAIVEGNNGLGPAIGAVALKAAMEKAAQNGIAAVFCRGSNHFGPIAPYAWMAAQEGFASMIASNATTTIAPSGGREARLGNNPLGFGFPNPGGDPVILDMAMSVVARAKIRDAARAGQEIPDTWATDADGRPTTDPHVALKGFLSPVGGYKGYGLSLCVDLMTGLLSGAAYLTHVRSWSNEPEAPQDLGHTFILIDTKRLMPAGALTERMNDFAGIIHDTPRVDEAVPVMLPGEREMRNLAAAAAGGITLPADLVEDLRRLSARA